MSLITLFLLALGLSMDAFAVSVCKGLAMKQIDMKKAILCGIYFGGFQALMPLIGYMIGSQFRDSITAIDHWISLILLSAIGINMIRESRKEEDEGVCEHCRAKEMFFLAIATSIDALAVGITFAFLPNTNIIAAILFIGVTTFIISILGVKIGSVFGIKYKSRAEFAGGVILIVLGFHILFEHLCIF